MKTIPSSSSCTFQHIPVILCEVQMFFGLSSFAVCYLKNNINRAAQ